jgi:hypothetical protein
MTTQPTVYRRHLPMQTRPNGSERESRSPDGQVVGAASVTLSQVIDSYFCHVNVTPDHRRRGIGMRLYAAVYDLIDPSIPVLARAMSSQPLRRRFAESIGCTVLVHCPEPWVEPSSAPGQQWIAQQRLPDGYQTVTMNNLPIEQVEKAWAAYFEWAHRPFGSVHTDRLPLYWSHYSRGLDAHASMLSIGASTNTIRGAKPGHPRCVGRAHHDRLGNRSGGPVRRKPTDGRNRRRVTQQARRPGGQSCRAGRSQHRCPLAPTCPKPAVGRR